MRKTLRRNEGLGNIRFDVDLLADRLVDASPWLHGSLPGIDIGLFGASTGGGAALVAAARLPERIRGVVSRGGRPDLARQALPDVRAPTLLIVGVYDPVITMNAAAMTQMVDAEVKLNIVPGASHLFVEPGKLEIVADLARDWFLRHLSPTR